ncbi:MAG: hypothetical protein IJP92_00590 [Lachnospiraceae bacterium]|nr:hypothetical protein [Lachnospiraceae bacterium]
MDERTTEEQIIRSAMSRVGVTGRPMLADLIGVSDRTLKRKFREPEKITIWELRRIISKAHLSDQEVLNLLHAGIDV